jgi:magnesium chelatase subunit I
MRVAGERRLVRHAGLEELDRALEVSALACLQGGTLHVHAEGPRGTGKTTAIRSAAARLGTMLRVSGCPYQCDPEAPHCPLHRGLDRAALDRLGVERVPRPFLEISASAKLATVVGGIDLARLAAPDRVEVALLPGTLARAHRGVVFVDEVNRLADTAPEVADALLDVMGTKPGRLQIEEAGLPPVVLPCRVTVWAASNPDEDPGPLEDVRRQLADRFDLVARVRRPAEPEAVCAVLAQAAEEDPAPADGPPSAPAWEDLAARPLPPVEPAVRLALARLYCEFQIESLRAVLAWEAAARLEALRAGRARATLEDAAAVAPAVLRHRVEPEVLGRLLDALGTAGAPAPAASPEPPAAPPEPGEPAERAAPPWVRWALGGGRRGAASARAAGAPAVADPATLPPLAPRARARPLTELPPAEWCAPAEPGGRTGGLGP